MNPVIPEPTEPVVSDREDKTNFLVRYVKRWRFTKFISRIMKGRFTKTLKENLFVLTTIAAVLLGFLAGCLMRNAHLSDTAQSLIFFPGELFMRLLKLLVLPLVAASLISALSQLTPSTAKQLGLRTVSYYAVTATAATVIGMSVVLLIHPGDPSIKGGRSLQRPEDHNADTIDNVMDMIRNLVPDNVIGAAVERDQTKVVSQNWTGDVVKEVQKIPGVNVLGILTFSMMVGIATSQTGDAGIPVRTFFISLESIMLLLIEGAMWFAPIGIVSLVATSIAEVDDVTTTIAALSLYVTTVLTGLAIHILIAAPAIYFLVTRQNPFRVMRVMIPAFMTSLGTASSSAALPIALVSMEEECNLDPRISRFVLPLGATCNMDGNALYEAVAVIFIAQLNGIPLTFAELLTVSLTATIASAGMNAVPAGLVSIMMILSTVGLPVEDVSLIITVDWLLDRIRTAICTMADGLVASAVEKSVTLGERSDDEEYAENKGVGRVQSKEQLVSHV